MGRVPVACPNGAALSDALSKLEDSVDDRRNFPVVLEPEHKVCFTGFRWDNVTFTGFGTLPGEDFGKTRGAPENGGAARGGGDSSNKHLVRKVEVDEHGRKTVSPELVKEL